MVELEAGSRASREERELARKEVRTNQQKVSSQTPPPITKIFSGLHVWIKSDDSSDMIIEWTNPQILNFPPPCNLRILYFRSC